ncbi:hypothetical protein [Pseudoalteromonas sp. MMG005]|uniref:hypothetical protein n=1 Tax=Pseudoalteromonas sp. MMG005 TaxID=2822682 RepID=UPI001B3A0DD1|nr:hypothetical protein [Pseudoalteromonas sp. MMG005]MBQ4847618.1 hypothetical protein [Pseudoalteromonas sp. MMG005]
MARRYNAGSQANSGSNNGNISFNITNQVVVQDAQDDAAATRTGENIGRQITALILNDIQRMVLLSSQLGMRLSSVL